MKSLSAMRFITGFILLLVSIQSYADQWYHVELVVFEQLSNNTDEQWPAMSGNDIRASLAPGMSTPQIQPASNNTLNSIASRLSSSSQYRVHYHQSWQQYIMRKGSAKAVKILSANGLIEGTVRLDKASYLHASVNLWLKQNAGETNNWSDASATGTNISAPHNPHLVESRRIRSNKLDFFDHPKMGALLKITPISTPAGVE
ncbi:hypothetical protein LCGC14_1023330 [marine sediment metagenome]|uniref:Peptidoglycan-binding protein CsiV n=1 Tax=marine sediment metagenome TaxID=412755 RepID=A0A0F9R2M0_9ZZZZ|nr:hypothetical protein [Methylophaga sp.]HEC60415.1 hypothetical protein [Methylophaga sp.]